MRGMPFTRRHAAGYRETANCPSRSGSAHKLHVQNLLLVPHLCVSALRLQALDPEMERLMDRLKERPNDWEAAMRIGEWANCLNGENLSTVSI